MNKTLLSVLLLALVGCAPIPFEPLASCEAEGIHFLLETERSCELLTANAKLARDLLVPNFITEEKWANVSKVPVYVRESEEPFSDHHVIGNYHTSPGGDLIELEHWALALGHEFLHWNEVRHLGIHSTYSAKHNKWDERGYSATNGEFRSYWWLSNRFAAGAAAQRDDWKRGALTKPIEEPGKNSSSSADRPTEPSSGPSAEVNE